MIEKAIEVGCEDGVLYHGTAVSGDDGSGLDQVACKLTKFRLNSNLIAGTWASLPGFHRQRTA
jgi:hypothetical protein